MEEIERATKQSAKDWSRIRFCFPKWLSAAELEHICRFEFKQRCVIEFIVGVTPEMRGELRAIARNIYWKRRHRDENGRPRAKRPLSLQ
jgi:hypothetical protein